MLIKTTKPETEPTVVITLDDCHEHKGVIIKASEVGGQSYRIAELRPTNCGRVKLWLIRDLPATLFLKDNNFIEVGFL
jgi:hypothetical protein